MAEGKLAFNPIDEVEVPSDIGFTTSEQNDTETEEGGEEPAPDGEQESKSEDSEGSEESGDETPAEKITVGEDEYTLDEVKDAIKDSQNKKDWSKSNTEKAQELAELRKSLEPLINIISGMKADKYAIEDIKELLVDRLGEEKKEEVEAALAFDAAKFPSPFEKELAERDEKLKAVEAKNAQLEGENAAREERDRFAKDMKISQKKAQEVLDFAEKHYNETKTFLPLDQAYKLMNYDSVAEIAGKKKLGIPKPPSKGNGAKEVKQETKKPTSIDDVDVKGWKFNSE